MGFKAFGGDVVNNLAQASVRGMAFALPAPPDEWL